ncbi:Protein of unknown function [Lysobacter sp. yr284]|uniref:DUF2884 family protein n=1 Tax=Lysobacter sp. yr284 TaxID=1761791 RepID=UPI00089A14D5|nr:DUF2884 family protein [Lysobacter sp. yr284]SDY82715.1 Protein of unknown function [Lysobacter sp. yr284]
MSARPLFRLAAAATMLACGAASASVEIDSRCEIDSPYQLTLNERSLILTRQDGEPKAIVMRQGRLFVDDRWVELSAQDARRLAEFERGARATMPETQAIAREAADIALVAIGEVAVKLGNHPDRTQAKVAQARKQLDASLRDAIGPTRFSGKRLGDGIGKAVGEAVPLVIGDLVGGAVSAALSGDIERFEKLDNFDAQIEAAVKPRADALERRSDRLCQSVRALDELENALTYRFDDRPLDLLKVDYAPARPHTAEAGKR